MAANSNTYVYNALPSATCVRLIKFDQRGSANGEISFTLHVFELNSAPAFDALSYTWGDPSCPYLSSPKLSVESLPAVRCNGASLKVQPNLLAALKELQTVDIRRATYIWIDAICIDQGNHSERSSQVQMMGALYEQAETVIVWLGPEDETTSDAFSVLERLGSVGRVPRNKEQLDEARAFLSHIGMWDIYDASCYRVKLGIEPITDRQWLSVAALLHRPYFKRVWVIQEITQARRIVVVCGKRLLDWFKLSAALVFLTITNWYQALHTEVLNLRVTDPKARAGFEAMLAEKAAGSHQAMALVQTHQFTKGDAGRYRLEQLLGKHRSCLSTDPRDKIYSLLGIASFDKPPLDDPRKARSLVANYELPVEILYTRVARLLFESRGDLRMLSQRESNRERSLKSLPSWVPDFSVWQIPPPLPEKGNWCANGDMAWTADGRSYDDGMLEVQGQLVGVIEACANPPFDTLETPLWGSIAEVARGTPDYYQSIHGGISARGETRIEALARTCIADTLGSQMPAPAELLYSQFMNRVAQLCATGYKWYGDKSRPITSRIAGKMHRFMLTKFDNSVNEPRVTPWIRLFKEEPEDSGYNSAALAETMENMGERFDVSRYADFARQAELVLGYRILFRTGNKLLGAGPIDSREGDEVWVLAGLSEPVVLRPIPGKHQHVKTRQFMGAAYVHGVMHGEVTDSSLPKENIILQ